MNRAHLFLILVLLLMTSLSIPVSQAQDATIEITGSIEAVGDHTITVNGLSVDLTSIDANLVAGLTPNTTIRIVGSLNNGTVIAIRIEVLNAPEPEPLPASVAIEKSVSVDGGVTWGEADDAPGPDVQLDTQVSFRFVVTNTGQAELTSFTLTDSMYDLSVCALPPTLSAGASFDCVIGPFDAHEGQHTNLATILAAAGEENVQDTDAAHYFGGDRPSIDIEKYVSTDHESWDNADSAPGLTIALDHDAFFRFVVTNDGNVPLTNLAINDSSYEVTGCAIPETLEPGGSFECAVGPIDVLPGQHTNTVTVFAAYHEFTVLDSDTASYFGGEKQDDASNLPVTIVIEGPVQQININIITIYNIDIELKVDDPILTVIQVGDVVHVEGNMAEQGDTMIIVVVNIIIINVDIVINDTGTVVWRDSGSCGNPPPPWAPANGWRRRCENSQGNQSDKNKSKGKSDDDDD
ncbi:MAG: hypothetical protein K8J31_06055 [Anaerolineae bacterium]|nr:hypothetical protein [Anaerolineae bacterium]